MIISVYKTSMHSLEDTLRKNKKIFKTDFFHDVIGIFPIDSWTALAGRSIKDYESPILYLTGSEPSKLK